MPETTKSKISDETTRNISYASSRYLSKTNDSVRTRALEDTLMRYASRMDQIDAGNIINPIGQMLGSANASTASTILDIVSRYQADTKFPMQVLLEQLNNRYKLASPNTDYVNNTLKPEVAAKETEKLERMAASFNSPNFRIAMDQYAEYSFFQEGIILNFARLADRDKPHNAKIFLDFIGAEGTQFALKKIFNTSYRPSEFIWIINDISNLIETTKETKLPQMVIELYDGDSNKFNSTVHLLNTIKKINDDVKLR